MSYRPSRGFGWSLAILLALGGGGWAAWWKVNSAPEETRLKGVWAALRTKEREGKEIDPKAQVLKLLEDIRVKGVWAALRSEERAPKPWAPGEKAELDRKAKALTEKLLAEFPALRVTPRPVADEENGFLLLLQLAPPKQSSLPVANKVPGRMLEQAKPATQKIGPWVVSSEFKALVDGFEKPPWSRERAERLLAEHPDADAYAERLGSLHTRSSAGGSKDLDVLMGVTRGAKFCSDLLLLKARIAAERGNEEEALRLVAAAKNIGSHLHEVETPCLLGETVTILTDLGVSGRVVRNLLPALGRKADLARWHALLGSRAYNTTEFARVMCGEWNVGAGCLVHPAMLTAQRNGASADVEAAARATAQWYSDLVTGLPKVGLAELGSALHGPGNVSGLSKEAKATADFLASGLRGWERGYTRASRIIARDQAALELLKLEQDGATLTVADAERVTRDPVSGKAFALDPATRTVAMPAGVKAEDQPVKLPW